MLDVFEDLERQQQSETFLDRKSTRLNSSHTVIYTLSLHDALPISTLHHDAAMIAIRTGLPDHARCVRGPRTPATVRNVLRSEEHTSELQSHSDLHSFPTRRSSDLNTPS